MQIPAHLTAAADGFRASRASATGSRSRKMMHLALLVLVGLGTSPAIAQQAKLPAEQTARDDYSDWNDTDEPRRHFYGSVGFGLDFSRGDFGQASDTDYLSVPAFLKLEWEPISFRVSMPFVLIDGSDQVLGGGDGPIPTDTRPTVGPGGTRREYGFGDVVTSLRYSWYPDRSGLPIVDVTTKVKIPTAESAIGTGKTDLTLQLDVTQMLGAISVFGGVGYRFKGGTQFDDILLASGGLGLRVSRSVSMGVAYDWRQSSVSGVADSQEVSPYLSIRTSKHTRFGPYAVLGLSSASPDWGVGSTFSIEF